MNDNAIAKLPVKDIDAATVESVLLHGDIGRLTSAQKVSYYNRVCESVGLNPLTQPFAFITLNGKLTFYALKSCTEQLRRVHGVSLSIVSREVVEGCYVVAARATDKSGRVDESLGVVPIDKLQGESRSNAMMKAETKAKRRVTLSICGLGMLDESEADSIPGAKREPMPVIETVPVNETQSEPPHDPVTGEVNPADAAKASTIIDDLRDLRDQLKWSSPHARNWLKKHFGSANVLELSLQKLEDARTLMRIRLGESEQNYEEELAAMVELGRASA